MWCFPYFLLQLSTHKLNKKINSDPGPFVLNRLFFLSPDPDKSGSGQIRIGIQEKRRKIEN